MGEIEKRAHKTARRARMQDILLVSAYTMGVFTVAMLAPNVLRLLKFTGSYNDLRTDASRRMQKTLSRMRASGYIRVSEKGSYELTTKGRKHAGRMYALYEIQKKPKRWDGRWRIVMFDIWEKRRAVRDCLRQMLMRIGFVQLQHSVWVYPYDCEEVIAFIRTELKAGSGIQYFVADGLENSDSLKVRFGLS